MISKKNIDDVSTAAGTSARFSLLGLLLLSFGLLLSVFQPVAAQTYTPSPQKDYSVAPSGLDIVEITETPTPPNGTIQTLYVSINNSTSLISVTLVNGVGNVQFSNPVGSVPVNIYTNPDGDPASLVGSINMHFIAAPGPPVAANSYFTVVTNNSDANGTAQNVVEAFLFDQYGNPVGTDYNPLNPPTVDWTVESGAGSASFVGNPNATISSAGTSTIPLTDNIAETNKIQAVASYTNPITNVTTTLQLTDQSGNNFLPVTFVQPQPSPANSYVVTVVSPNPANGTAQDEVQAYVVDGTGIPLKNYTVTFTFTGPLTMTTTATTNGSGVATAYFTSNTPGTYQVQAQVMINGSPQYLFDQANPANDFVTVVFYNPPPNTAASYITPVITPMPADGTSQDEVQVYLVGTNGLPLTGVTVNFSVQAPGTATLINVTATTDANGMATAYLTNTNVEYDNVVATYTDPNTNITYTLNDKVNTTQPYSIVQFVAGPPDPSKSYIVVTQDNATANGTATDIVTVYLYDAEGHPISGATVPWPASSGSATLYGTPTSNNNVYTASYVSNSVGGYQIAVTVDGVTIDDQSTPPNGYVTIHFVHGQPVTGDPGGPSDGGNPGGGNPGNGGSTPPNNGGGNNGGGNNGGGNNGGGGGNNGGGGTSGGDPGTNNGYTEIYVLPQYNYRLADGQQQDSVYVYITDATKNPVPGVTVTFYIANPGGTITSGEQWTTSPASGPITATTGADGIARVAMTSTAPGSVWVYASIVVGGTPELVAAGGNPETYDVEADFVTKPDVTNIQTALTVIVGEALADGTQQNVVKAHVVDIDGNVMPDQQVYFAIDSGTGTIVTPQPVMTDANGDAFIQITSNTVGYVLITATVDSEKIVFGSPARVYFAMINIYVPRAFSPNNDGTNDILKPILVGISTFHYFNIYNRWGNLIFTTQDPNQGWDGTFKGVPQPVETYLWIAEGIDENGHKVVQKGMTSLVR